MWIFAALLALWVVPAVVYRRSRRHASPHTWRNTGVAFGAIISPASSGMYGLFWFGGMLGPLGLPLVPLGLLGLMLDLVHITPGFRLAEMIGLREPATVVEGIEWVCIEGLNAIVWSIVYGAVGFTVDHPLPMARQTRTGSKIGFLQPTPALGIVGQDRLRQDG